VAPARTRKTSARSRAQPEGSELGPSPRLRRRRSRPRPLPRTRGAAGGYPGEQIARLSPFLRFLAAEPVPHPEPKCSPAIFPVVR
jgi:hypothetical protein